MSLSKVMTIPLSSVNLDLKMLLNVTSRQIKRGTSQISNNFFCTEAYPHFFLEIYAIKIAPENFYSIEALLLPTAEQTEKNHDLKTTV